MGSVISIRSNILTAILNEILLNSMTNIWYKQAYVKGYDFKPITFKNAVNMFERMEISESIYKGIV